MSDVYRLSHLRRSCKHQIVFATEDRRNVCYGQRQSDTGVDIHSEYDPTTPAAEERHSCVRSVNTVTGWPPTPYYDLEGHIPICIL